ncbi:MAG: tryptophan-rich sensory protein [Lachnospiraceae bacterium]|jgi:benzodiazapine receptor|nr:tryptophan-rich sensory protein [Lachnospiraceae bacterium]
MWAKRKPYFISILIALGTGGLSAFLIRDNVYLYALIRKPPLAPPAILFPIVWTPLYILMGVSCARVFLQHSSYPDDVFDALLNYAFQLILNFLWPVIFFNMRTFLFAFIWIVVLWSGILKMIFKFSRLDTAAAYLQIPYLLWATFAGYLNFMIYLLN